MCDQELVFSKLTVVNLCSRPHIFVVYSLNTNFMELAAGFLTLFPFLLVANLRNVTSIGKKLSNPGLVPPQHRRHMYLPYCPMLARTGGGSR